MRNLFLLRDSFQSVPPVVPAPPPLDVNEGPPSSESERVVSVTGDGGRDEVLVLTSHGQLHAYAIESGAYTFTLEQSWNVNAVSSSETDDSWFSVAVISETCSVVCISRSGKVVCIRDVPLAEGRQVRSPEVTLEGDVESGIAAAAWSPDQSKLVIVTNNDSVLCMTNGWEVITEVPLEPIVKGSGCVVSWRGDSEQLTVTTTDASDSITRVRLYSSELELTATGRNVALGPGSLLRGLSLATAFATNGSLVAVAQERVTGKPQIAFLERNGLRHGDFDIHLPVVTSASGACAWKVSSIHWDLPSTLLAVTLIAEGIATAVQVYTRGNYHWYLKQQWVRRSDRAWLECLGFDREVIGRLYLAERRSSQPSSSADVGLRIVDFVWDNAGSSTADSSAAVVDGEKLLLTPLGIAVVPPPMSKYTLRLGVGSNGNANIDGASRYVSFWRIPGEETAWGLASLCSQHVTLVFGNKVGAPISSSQRVVPLPMEGSSDDNIQGLREGCFRMLQVTPVKTEHQVASAADDVIITLLGSRLNAAGSGDAEDFLCCLLVGSDGAVKAVANVADLGGQVYRLCEWPEEEEEGGDEGESLIGVAVNTSEGFEVRPLSLRSVFAQLAQREKKEIDFGSCAAERRPRRQPLRLPEPCTHVSVVLAPTPNAIPDSPSASRAVAIGLCPRNRLYAGETLLVAGASCYALNTKLSMLLYITVGTQPSLHFIPFGNLRFTIWDEEGGLDEVTATGSLECGAVRPVERGSRLVCCVEGSSAVVVQMPRGNLETFEPRHLVLICAAALMDAQPPMYHQCLLLLRRQRVDLNFLVDYRPLRFLEQVETLVNACLAGSSSGADFLSLLVTALEPYDSTTGKYRGYGSNQGSDTVQSDEKSAAWTEGNKVDSVCLAVREVLLPHLVQGQLQHAHALHPALCTLAKPSPPQLEAALGLIRSACEGSSSTPGLVSGAGAGMTSARAHAAIKYLSLLASGEALFDAALGACDFELARAVGRLCQMDPKYYLHIIEGFEEIGQARSSNVGDGDGVGVGVSRLQPVRDALVAIAVNSHLKRPYKLADSTLDGVERFLELASDGNLSTGSDEASRLYACLQTACAELLSAALLQEREDKEKEREEKERERERERSEAGRKDHVPAPKPDPSEVAAAERTAEQAKLQGALYGYTLPRLTALADREVALNASNASKKADGTQIDLLRPLLTQFREAYGHYCLSRSLQHQALAAFLSIPEPNARLVVQTARDIGDWSLALTLAAKFTSSANTDKDKSLHPARVAAEIIASFRAAQEQGGDAGDDVFDSITSVAGGSSDAQSGSADNANSRALQAAQLCIDYCADTEAAVGILGAARLFLPAVEVALRGARQDLVEEIAANCRATASELCAALPIKAAKLQDSITELQALWANPQARLEAVAAAEPALQRCLELGDGGGLAEDDDQSVLSLASGRTNDSFASNATGASVNSRASRSTAASAASGTTSVSVLSALSNATSSGATGPRTTFSIEGLEHSLLSRGTVQPWETDREQSGKTSPRKGTDRNKKRQQKKRHRGEGRDTMGLRREGDLCAELMLLAQVASLGRAIRDVSQCLLLLHGPGDGALASRLQLAMDSYCAAVISAGTPNAPLYPLPWLQARELLGVVSFQSAENESLSGENGYEKVAAEGIKHWRRLRLVALETR